MTGFRMVVAGLLLHCAPGLAQGPISYSRAVNSASYSPVLAQGSIFVLFGTGLGPDSLVQAAQSPLPLQLAGTSVAVSVGTFRAQCPIAYTSARQVAAILPSNTPPGDVQITTTYQTLTSQSFARVVRSTVGIFTVKSSGAGVGIITGADYITKSVDQPAKPAEVVIAWATGLGPADGPDAEPGPGKQFANTEVFAGDRPARVLYAGRSGCCAGLDQIVFEVPDGLTSCFVPVTIRTPGGLSNFVMLPISADGGVCETPGPGVSTAIWKRVVNGDPLKNAFLAVGPLVVLEGAGFPFTQELARRLSAILGKRVREADVTALLRAYRDQNTPRARRILAKYATRNSSRNKSMIGQARNLLAAAAAPDSQGAAAIFHRTSGLGSFSSHLMSFFQVPGSCTVSTPILGDSAADSRPLDAGRALTLNGPGGTATLNRTGDGVYEVALGPSGSSPNTTPGRYVLTGPGGADVAAFSATLNLTDPMVWMNKSSISTVDRTKPLTLTWAGGSRPGFVLIAGTGSDSTGSQVVFQCIERTEKGTFAIPAFVLSALAEGSSGTIVIAPHPFTAAVAAGGLDIAFFADASSDSKEVTYR